MKDEMLRGPKLLLYYLGIFLMFLGGLLVLPLLGLLFYPGEADETYCFVIPSAISVLTGYLIFFFLRGKPVTHLERHQDAVLVVLIWIMSILVSSTPFLLTGKYNFTQAVFEVTSGYTTTGLSVVDVANCSHIFLLYRTLTLFVGGVGFVLILTSAISDKLSLNLYEAEGHNDKLLPNLAKSSRLIFGLYSGYILLGMILYLLCGMDAFDAFNHAIAAVSTGGFSTRAGSIYEYHSLSIELVTILLMLLGSTSFLVHICLIRGKFKDFFLHSETLFSFFLLVSTIAISATLLFLTGYEGEENLALTAAFQMVSALTTTGFQSVQSMSSLPHFFLGIMIILMLIGGGLGSTAGGIKQYRIIVCLKGIKNWITGARNSKKIVHHVFIRKADSLNLLETKDYIENYVFIALYLLFFVTGSFVFSCFGYSAEDSMFEFASCISTVGLSVGITGYYAHPLILWTAILGMFFGRLELLVVFESILSSFHALKGGIAQCLLKARAKSKQN